MFWGAKHESGKRGRWPTAVLTTGLLIFLPVTVVANDSVLQLPPRPDGSVGDIFRDPTLPLHRRIYVTYSGEIQMRFPNYTIRTNSYLDGTIAGEPFNGLIFRNDAGMAWDGRSLILTPNYPFRLLIQNRFVRGIVGNPQLSWPWVKPEPFLKEKAAGRLIEFPPLVGYRSLEPSTIEGFMGPDHGPLPQPPLVAESYVKPPEANSPLPKLGADLNLERLPSATTIVP